MHYCEIILTKIDYTSKDWNDLVNGLARQVGGLQPLDIIVTFNKNHVRFFIMSKKDVSGLSGNYEGFNFVETSNDPVEQYREGLKKSAIMRSQPNSNIFDIKERYALKHSKDVKLIRLKIRKLGENVNSTIYVVSEYSGINTLAKKFLNLFPAHLFRFNVKDANNYIFTTLPNYLSLEKTMHIMQTSSEGAVFKVDGFPYSSDNFYIDMSSYEFNKHSLIVGASGSGKSKLIELLIDRLSKYGDSMNNYRVVVIDPHASLEDDLKNIQGSRVINLGNESAQLFPDSNADISATTELTTTLFQSLLKDQYGPKLERVLRFSVYVLLTAQIMSLDNLKLFVTDTDARIKILNHVEGFVPHNIQTFFGTSFNELKTQYYNEAIMPIVSLVDEMQLQPSLAGEATQSLTKNIQDNFLTVFSLNKVTMGEKAVKTAAGLLMQQIFLIAQARVLPYKLILVVDEVSIVQNPALASILSEARKFNLSIILTQQYYSQVDQKIQDAMASNIVNYYIFRVSEEDARTFEGNLQFEIPKELTQLSIEKGQSEEKLRLKMLTEQSSRDCYIRISAGGQILPVIKAKTMTIETKVNPLSGAHYNKVKLQKLPPKMQLRLEEEYSQYRSSVMPDKDGELSEHIIDETHNITQSEKIPYEDSSIINVQRILADQSSSRDDAKKGVEE